MKLNLETKNKEQEVLKEYLENNASETLANKINTGVKITKDDKTLINKKDLDGFISYATEEARKQVVKNARSACIHSDIVFGWAMHYFEEDSIEGNLYNEDGTEYKTIVKNISKPTTIKVEPKIEKPKQPSLFDFLTDNNPKQENENLSYKAQCSTFSQPDPLESDNKIVIYEQDEELFGNDNFNKNDENLTKNTVFLEKNQEIDYETGEIITKQETNDFDKVLCKMISILLENKVVIK